MKQPSAHHLLCPGDLGSPWLGSQAQPPLCQSPDDVPYSRSWFNSTNWRAVLGVHAIKMQSFRISLGIGGRRHFIRETCPEDTQKGGWGHPGSDWAGGCRTSCCRAPGGEGGLSTWKGRRLWMRLSAWVGSCPPRVCQLCWGGRGRCTGSGSPVGLRTHGSRATWEQTALVVMTLVLAG